MSSIDNTKQAMGWQAADARSVCANCKHVQKKGASPLFNHPALFCRKGSFYTQRFATCDNWSYDSIEMCG